MKKLLSVGLVLAIGRTVCFAAPPVATRPMNGPLRVHPANPRPGLGAALDGKPRFDLTLFNQTYFDRMRRRVVATRDNGICASGMLFNGFSIEGKGNVSGYSANRLEVKTVNQFGVDGPVSRLKLKSRPARRLRPALCSMLRRLTPPATWCPSAALRFWTAGSLQKLLHQAGNRSSY